MTCIAIPGLPLSLYAGRLLLFFLFLSTEKRPLFAFLTGVLAALPASVFLLSRWLSARKRRTSAGQEARERLKQELLALLDDRPAFSVSPVILQSAAYAALQEQIARGRVIREKDSLWRDLERAVSEASPRFKTDLQLLTRGRLTELDYRTALLIKCGVLPSQMTILFSRSKGCITSRRISLGAKIFDEKRSVKTLDGLIRLL